MACPEAHTPRAGSCSSPPTTSGHFALATGLHPCTRGGGGARVGRSARAPTCVHLSCSRTFTSASASTSRRPPTGSPRRRTCCSRSRRGRRWAGDGITVNALMPGRDRDGAAAPRHRGPSLTGCAPRSASPTSAGRRLEQGAATFVVLADVAAAGRRWRPVLRGLQRGGAAPAGRPPGRCGLCAQPPRGRSTVAGLRRPACPSSARTAGSLVMDPGNHARLVAGTSVRNRHMSDGSSDP